jgi:hypothetical protein
MSVFMWTALLTVVSLAVCQTGAPQMVEEAEMLEARLEQVLGRLRHTTGRLEAKYVVHGEAGATGGRGDGAHGASDGSDARPAKKESLDELLAKLRAQTSSLEDQYGFAPSQDASGALAVREEAPSASSAAADTDLPPPTSQAAESIAAESRTCDAADGALSSAAAAPVQTSNTGDENDARGGAEADALSRLRAKIEEDRARRKSAQSTARRRR